MTEISINEYLFINIYVFFFTLHKIIRLKSNFIIHQICVVFKLKE